VTWSPNKLGDLTPYLTYDADRHSGKNLIEVCLLTLTVKGLGRQDKKKVDAELIKLELDP
jgi:hypothetical protein